MLFGVKQIISGQISAVQYNAQHEITLTSPCFKRKAPPLLTVVQLTNVQYLIYCFASISLNMPPPFVVEEQKIKMELQTCNKFALNTTCSVTTGRDILFHNWFRQNNNRSLF